jgi:predicted nuclease of predicted toxin-antitoxin system
MRLRFFADHGVPALVVRLLRVDDHEVFVIKEHIPPDSKDPTHIAKAQHFDAILVSLNGDFSDIVTYPPAA